MEQIQKKKLSDDNNPSKIINQSLGQPSKKKLHEVDDIINLDISLKKNVRTTYHHFIIFHKII